uniref:Reverse transcriptase domain-containing protein n=1 Tax=Knipowitschia caucasica TaxID=637954 RepID=A0AAV2LEQ2_KNICA
MVRCGIGVRSDVSDSRIINTGAPQGCVLSPLLFSLYTNHCTSSHDSVKLIKFADDTTLIGLISNNDESAYRREVDRLVSWCSGNNLELNAQKTVEMIVDFRKSTVPPPPPSVMDSPITSVESFRFLGTTITQDLKWEPTISSLIKKAQQRMYFLRQLRKAKLPAQMLVQFYTAIIESILTSSITVWFAGATVRDKQRLQRIVRSAEEVIGRSLPSLQDLKLQRELRVTNLEELKKTVQTYSEEIQKLKMLLEAAEKSCRAESKCSQRQQRALHSTVTCLTETVKQLQEENGSLRMELSTEAPHAGLQGYRKWSKRRLLRRLLDLELPEHKARPTLLPKELVLLDQETQTLTMATEAGTAVETMAEPAEQELKQRLSQWEDHRAELHERLKRTEEELEQAKKREKELEDWKSAQSSKWDIERQQHKQELKVLWTKLQMLEDERELAALTSSPLNNAGDIHRENRPGREAQRRDQAARLIQSIWRTHRGKGVVLLQSALRGHLHRQTQLKAAHSSNHSDGDTLELNNLVLVQSVFRGHLTRSAQTLHSLSSRFGGLNMAKRQATPRPADTAQSVPPSRANQDEAAAVHSDDSDDIIIVNPSRPIRRREVLIV